MALPTNADVVVVHGYWLDEVSGRGVRQENGRPATVTFRPVPLPGQSVTRTPNLRDTVAVTHVKLRTRVAVVDPDTGYYAMIVVSSNDPDLDAYGGREVTFLDEDPFTIEIPYNSLPTTVTPEMAEKTGLVPDSEVRAIWLLNASLIVTPKPVPPINYLTSVQTLSTLASGIEVHDADLQAHPNIRQIIATKDAENDAALLAHTSRVDNPHATTKAQVGLGNADNTSDANKPVSTAGQTALNLKVDKSANLSDLANSTTARTNLGLGNVNNTSDANKPVSTAQQTALNLKADAARTISPGTGLNGGGDLTANRTLAVTFGTTAGTVTDGADARLSNARTPTAHTHPVSELTATGTRDATTFLRGDNTWDVLRGTAVNGNADATLTAASAPTQLFNTALTAARAVNLPTTGNSDGDTFRVVRTAAASGAFNLNVGTGPVKALTAASTWCDVTWVGSLSVWTTTGSGAL